MSEPNPPFDPQLPDHTRMRPTDPQEPPRPSGTLPRGAGQPPAQPVQPLQPVQPVPPQSAHPDPHSTTQPLPQVQPVQPVQPRTQRLETQQFPAEGQYAEAPGAAHEQGYPPAPGAPGAPYSPPPARTSSGSGGRGRGLAAGVLAGALVLGGAAGLGGAAAYDQFAGGSEKVTADDIDANVLDPLELVSVNRVTKDVLPVVVKIDAIDESKTTGGSGSGIILSEDGEILTNHHVVEPALDDGTLTIYFDDGSTADAELIGTDPMTDTALIKAKDVSDLKVAKVGSSDRTEVGQAVVAVGSPYGLQATVTAGIVSALHRPIVMSSEGPVYDAIQTDAPINPGNSGGALVNMAGQVIGINSSIELARGNDGGGGDLGSIGIGYAIPVDNALPIIEQIRNDEEVTHARLGVFPREDYEIGEVVHGAEVDDVDEGSAAEDAGIEEGDVITAIGDIAVSGPKALLTAVYAFRPGEKAEVTLIRDDKTETVEVTFGSDAD